MKNNTKLKKFNKKIVWKIFKDYFSRSFLFIPKEESITKYLKKNLEEKDNYYLKKLCEFDLIPIFEKDTVSPFIDAFLRQCGIMNTGQWKKRNYLSKRNPYYEDFLYLLDVATNLQIEWNAVKLTHSKLKNPMGITFFLSNITKGEWSNRIEAKIETNSQFDVNWIETKNKFMENIIEVIPNRMEELAKENNNNE